MTPSASGKRFPRLIPEFLSRDIWRKFFALVLATLCCWLIHKQVQSESSNQSIATIDNVNVHIRTDVSLHVPEANRIRHVQIRIKKNHAYRNMAFDSKDFSFEVMLEAKHLTNPGRHVVRQISENSYEITLTLTPDDIRSKPAGVTISKITEPEIKILCERVIAATVPVTIQTSGHLKDGFECTFTPKSGKATISGPASLVNSISELRSVPIRLSELLEGKIDTPLRLAGLPQGLHAELETNILHLDVVNTKSTGDWKFKDIPLLVLNRQNSNLVLKSKLPESVSVILYGLKTALEDVKNNPNQLMMCVDLSHYYAPGPHRVKVQELNLPKGLTVRWIDQDEIPIVLENSPEAYPEIHDPAPFLEGPTSEQKINDLLNTAAPEAPAEAQ